MLNPPPMLRISGPLFTLLTSITLSSTISTDTTPTPTPMSSQTHVIPLAELISDTIPQRPGRQRRLERDETKRKLLEAAAKSGFGASLPRERKRGLAREREVLAEGLAFSGLWVGEEVGRGKEFRLQLGLGQPGVEAKPIIENLTTPIVLDVSPRSDIDNAINGLTDLNGEEPISSGEVTLLEEFDVNSKAAPGEATSVADREDVKPDTPSWATLVSGPLTVVSKPSQKTAKARSMTSCLTEHDSISLWVRINGQTVRTKYMKLESGETPQLTAKTGKWTPFRFDIIRRAAPPAAEAKSARSRFKVYAEDENAAVLTYGSIVVMVDLQSGARSEPVKLVKVERNEAIVGMDKGHPVSELQRVGLVKVGEGVEASQGGASWYLSAPGARLGGGELLDPSVATRAISRRLAKVRKQMPKDEEVQPDTLEGVDADEITPKAESFTPENPSKRKKTRRNALALATLAEDEDNSSKAILSWSRAEREDREIVTNDGQETHTRTVIVEKVEDWMCWVIGGICA